MTEIAIRTTGLGKRFRRKWALRNCTIEIPAGRVVGLVGPNGAGKSTLMNLTVGLLSQTEGQLEVLGDQVRPNTVLHRVAYLDQEHSMYRNFRVHEMLKAGRLLNRHWNQQIATERLSELDIALDAKVGELSGGQRAQVALALALAKEPDLLILDEPVASLDPLARREMMSTLMAAKADRDCTVVLSSHVVSELERLCDYLIVLDRGDVKLIGDIDDLLEQHHVLVGPAHEADAVTGEVVHREDRGDRISLLVRGNRPSPGPSCDVQRVNLESLVMRYLTTSAPERVREVAA
ncbi:ABC transporter ATP-binding protein [Saccharopolyspora sp. K220]|uniref:ABC transporter ATP-binding protein n=1 Tax=Saccharopolyspora soli TaxID=2926618 RepID=UPI001F5740DF|nr:ABC transporter ATP-binding protein [Saccharopolyspora soli]MCI2419610.1 ABC transporter ATP-binding protein [Saccharopolyspora soli]